MNIQEFIKETLTQIANGASDVNESLAEVGGICSI